MTNVFKHLIIAILIAVFSLSGIAQNKMRYEAKIGYGFLMAHRSSMRHLVKDHSLQIECSFNINPKEGSQFRHCYRAAEYGLNFTYLNPGNAEEIGHCIGAYPHIKFRIGKKKYAPLIKLGAGLGWIQKPFNQESNNKNIAIGSQLNSIANISINKQLIWRSYQFKYGIAFTHFSNGAFSVPNLGLNIPTLFIGFGINPNNNKDSIQIVQSINQTFETKRERFHEVRINGGFREISLHKPKKHAVGGLTYQYFRPFSNKYAWTSGADFFINPSLKAASIQENSPQFISYQLGVFLGLELLFNTNSLYIQQGCYVFSPFKGNGSLYNRIGYRRRFDTGFIIHFGLKTHFGVAEYFETGIGYSFKNKHR